MNIFRLLIFAGLLSVALVQSGSVTTRHDLQEPRALRATCDETRQIGADLCENCQSPQDHGALIATPVAEDRQRLLKISRDGKRMMENHETTDMQVLIKQLQFDRCKLALARPSTVAKTPAELYTGATRSIVVVAGMYKCTKCSKWHASTATGFVIAESGAIVTNYHVVEAKKKAALLVMTADGHMLPVQRILAASRRDDLAILKVDADEETWIPLPIAASRTSAPVGSTVNVISHPANHFYSFTSGNVSRYATLQSPLGRTAVVTITADYARGSSGAPLLNDEGQVVGIVKSTESIYYSQTNGQMKNLQMVFKNCIPAESLRKLIDR